MFQQTAKPVDLIVIEATRIDSEPVEVGTVLKQVPPDLAMELACGGKVRVATDELVAEMKKVAKAQRERAATDADAAASSRAAADERMAALVGAAVRAALDAAGVKPAAGAAS